MNKSVFISTLGCSKNLVDSEVMLNILLENGLQKVDSPQLADIAVINTCGFIESAKEESINEILEIAKYKQIGKLKHLIVTGCLSQRYSEELKKELPEVDSFLGTTSFEHIYNIIQGLELGENNSLILDINHDLKPDSKRSLLTEKYTAFLKIAEGCDNLCTYCIIPKLRGKYRSRKLEDIVKEAKELAASGVKEIIIIAQDTTKYGMDIYNEKSLPRLLRELNAIEDLNWIRFLYSYPEDIDLDLILAVKESDKVCSYFDMPIQHSHDQVLKRMNRKTTGKHIEDTIALIRAHIPEAVLRTTLITGFPGETDEEFDALYDFVKKIEFDRLGVFAYSKEEGTPAAIMSGQVAEEIKEERKNKIMQLQQEISLRKNQALIGKDFEVIIEKEIEPNLYEARSYRDVPEIDGIIYVKALASHNEGEFIKVTIKDAMEYDLLGDEIIWI